MPGELSHLLSLLGRIPVDMLYLLVGAATALENVFPPIPSDVVVLLGAVLAGRGVLVGEIVFAAALAGNLLLALFVYEMGRWYGRGIFATGWGRRLLRPHQLRRMGRFYDRYGTATIFGTRFIPVFRVLVPAFAGISGLGFWRTAIPLVAASSLWYGILVIAGILAWRNLHRVVGWFEAVNVWLVGAAVLMAALLGLWWWRSRGDDPDGRKG